MGNVRQRLSMTRAHIYGVISWTLGLSGPWTGMSQLWKVELHDYLRMYLQIMMRMSVPCEAPLCFSQTRIQMRAQMHIYAQGREKEEHQCTLPCHTLAHESCLQEVKWAIVLEDGMCIAPTCTYILSCAGTFAAARQPCTLPWICRSTLNHIFSSQCGIFMALL
jgi:hypothetical protein